MYDSGEVSGLQSIVALGIVAILYFIPTIIAVSKNHPQKSAIILVNIFGGLVFGIGWVVAIVWCFYNPVKSKTTFTSSADELERLHDLLEKGVLTQEEFNRKKKQILKKSE